MKFSKEENHRFAKYKNELSKNSESHEGSPSIERLSRRNTFWSLY